MQLTNKEADFCWSALNEIANKVSGKLGYAVARNLRTIGNSLKEYADIKNELINKYGEKSENGDTTLYGASPNFEKYLEEIDEYSNITHDINIMQVSPEEVYKSPLTANVITNIMFMIKEDD